jgi:hypothetical protein
MKKASGNGKPALLHSEQPLFSLLPRFATYLEIDSVGIVGALNDHGAIIPLTWEPIVEEHVIHAEQDLTFHGSR